MTKTWFSEGLRFKCTGCGKCCTGTPGYVFLSEQDLHRLAEHFQLTPEEFAKQYTRKEEDRLALIDQPSTGDCIFLKDKKCTVYQARPMQCQTFPWWLHNLRNPEDWNEASRRCEGINHVDAPVVPSEEIEQQCLTYLDNLVDMDFQTKS